MRLVIHFDDNPAKQSVRDAFTDAHLAFLDAHKDRILAAGGLRDRPDGARSGALWIVDVENMEEAKTLYEQDPFWINGLRSGVKISVWTRAFAEIPVTI